MNFGYIWMNFGVFWVFWRIFFGYTGMGPPIFGGKSPGDEAGHMEDKNLDQTEDNCPKKGEENVSFNVNRGVSDEA